MKHPFMQLLLFILIIPISLAKADYDKVVPLYYSLSMAQQQYAKLQEKLMIYEAAAQHPWEPLYLTSILKVGKKNHNVLLLREHLIQTQDLNPEDSVHDFLFDRTLADAVANFQTRHGLKADGIVGKDTLAELNISPEERVNQIKINMQRWNDLSKKLTNRYILVNIPNYELQLIEDNQEVLRMKVIVGKPARPTPELNSTVTRIIFNPPWDVPDLIARRDIIPKILDNPNYLDEMNMRVLTSSDDNARVIDGSRINWWAMQNGDFNYHFRQEPGEKNALGLVKFEFYNEHDVYMHDTPAKELFDTDVRDYSSGCVRLERPFDLVSYLDPDLMEFRLQEILDTGKTTYVKIAKPISIFITYITAWVDESGSMQFRDDVYQKDN